MISLNIFFIKSEDDENKNDKSKFHLYEAPDIYYYKIAPLQ